MTHPPIQYRKASPTDFEGVLRLQQQNIVTALTREDLSYGFLKGGRSLLLDIISANKYEARPDNLHAKTTGNENNCQKNRSKSFSTLCI